VEALRHCRALLLLGKPLNVVGVADRVRARFPGLVLPDRPQLDGVLEAAGVPLRWSDEEHAYQPVGNEPGALTTFTRTPSRRETVSAVPTTPAAPGQPLPELPPHVQAAVAVEERLECSLVDGGFVALRVATNRLTSARAALARF